LLLEFCSQHADFIPVMFPKVMTGKGFVAMPSEQKNLDTLAAGTYTADVSLHTKPSRCVKHLMKRAQGGRKIGSHPLRIVMDGDLLRATGTGLRETFPCLTARLEPTGSKNLT
jgi:hypothetical protein